MSAGGFTTGIEDDYMIEERPTGRFTWLVRVRDNDEPSDIGVVAICADFPPLR